MRHARLISFIGVVFAAIGLTQSASAQGRFQVPEGCGSEAEFQSEVERLTGATGGGARPNALLIEALAAEPGGYELRLVIGDEQRVLHDPDCRVLFRSAIVISAAAYRGERAPETPALLPAPNVPASAAPSASPPAPPPAAASRPPAPPATRAGVSPARAAQPRAGVARSPAQRLRQQRLRQQRARAARARTPRALERPDVDEREARRVAPSPEHATGPSPARSSFAVDLGLGVSGGVLPDLGSVLELGARFELRPLAVELAARYWPERSGSRGGRGLDVSALGGRVAGLIRVAPALNMLFGLELDRLEGTGGEGVLGRHTDDAWQLAPTLGFNLITWDIRYLRLEIGAAARLSVLRPRFVVTGFGDLYRVPLLGADAIIRGVWLFP